MLLNPRAIAVNGVGYGPLPTALLGLWTSGEVEVAVPSKPTIQSISSPREGKRRSLSVGQEARRRSLRRQEEELLTLVR